MEPHSISNESETPEVVPGCLHGVLRGFLSLNLENWPKPRIVEAINGAPGLGL